MTSERIRIGVSSCLLGQRVRYDGGHKKDEYLTTILGPQVDFVPVCPEVEMGLGTPREPMDLVRQDGSLRMITVDTRIDHTDTLRQWAAARLEELARVGLAGYVLKADSPSCGMERVKVFDATRPTELTGRGLFAAALMGRFPDLPVEDERRLTDPAVRDAFMRRVLEFSQRSLSPVRRVSVVRVTAGAAPQSDHRRNTDPEHRRNTDPEHRRNTEPEHRSNTEPEHRSNTEPEHRRNTEPEHRRNTEPEHRSNTEDDAAVEEPLEIRLHDRPFVVIMRTPGADRELAAGFLFAEGIITDAGELGAVEHCRHPHHPEAHNVVNVFLLGDATARLDSIVAERRNVLANSSCGLCGRVTIDSLKTRAAPLLAASSIDADVLHGLPEALRAQQAVFDRTGGLHGAALFTTDGTLVASDEDVGRHNAVDKVIGRLLLDERLPLTRHVLAVSGRTSFEIVQKAWLAGIEIICAVSAPSSLAIELATEAGITLLGFARERSFNVYSHVQRINGM